MANSSSIAACLSKVARWRKPMSEATASNNLPALEVTGELTPFASICRNSRNSRSAKSLTSAISRRSAALLPRFHAKHQRRPAWLLDRCFATG